MSEQTRIRAEILKSMEANKFSDVSEPVYTRGFLRTYAEHLGLDGEGLVQLLDRQNQLPEEKEISLPTPAEVGALPSRTWLLFSALALILLGVAWQNADLLHSNKQKRVEKQPNTAVPALESGINNQDVSGKLPSPAFQTPQAVKFSGTEKNIQDTPQEEKSPQEQETSKEAAPKQESKTFANKTVTIPEAPDGARIRLYAKNDVWFEVRPKDVDKPVFSKILTAGRSYWVPARDDLLLDVGLPPALVVFIDGQRMGKSGIIDRRVRDLPLKPAFLKESYFGQDVHLEPNIPTKEDNADSSQEQAPSTPTPLTQTPQKAAGEANVKDVVVDDEKVKMKSTDKAE